MLPGAFGVELDSGRLYETLLTAKSLIFPFASIILSRLTVFSAIRSLRYTWLTQKKFEKAWLW